jgi:hypothetical protein
MLLDERCGTGVPPVLLDQDGRNARPTLFPQARAPWKRASTEVTLPRLLRSLLHKAAYRENRIFNVWDRKHLAHFQSGQ